MTTNHEKMATLCLEACAGVPVPAPAVPATYEIEDQLSLAETEMINAKAWSAGSQSRIHIGFAMTAISCARALLLQSAEVNEVTHHAVGGHETF